MIFRFRPTAADSEAPRGPAPLPCLHVGMPKTATTCMQQHLFARHGQIEYLGKYPNSRSSGGKYPHAAVQVMTERLLRSGRPRATERCRREMAALIGAALAAGRVPLWSREGHTSGGRNLKRRQARFFRRAFGPSQVILFVRRPDKFMESMYFQSLKGFQKSGRKRPSWTKYFGPLPRYFSLSQWLDVMWGLRHRGAFTNLLCADTADAYAAEFGRENVRVFLFEQFAEDPPAVIRSLCRFMGIDPEEGVRLMEGKRANDRWTIEQIEKLKAIERSPAELRAFREGTRQVRQRMLGLDEGNRPRGGPKARTEVPPEWRDRMREFVRDDHRRLAVDWGLPLARYGYSVEPLARAA